MEFTNKYKVQTLNLWSLLVKHSASEKEIALAQLHIRIPPSLKQNKKNKLINLEPRLLHLTWAN